MKGTLCPSSCWLYPIHDAEWLYIHEHGVEAFWKLERNPYDVGRPSAV